MLFIVLTGLLWYSPRAAKANEGSMDPTSDQETQLPCVVITSGGNVLTGDQTVIVGQYIDLGHILRNFPPGATPTAQQWTIDGNPIAGYTQANLGTQLTLLGPNDLNGDTAKFYWTYGSPPVKFQVTYTATVNGQNYSTTLNYQVLVPTWTWINSNTTDNPAIDNRGGHMGFGNETTSPGITYMPNVTTPANGAGQIALEQLGTVEKHKIVNGQSYAAISGAYLLDTVDFVPQMHAVIVTIGNNDTKSVKNPDGTWLWDSPSELVVMNGTVSVNQSFRTYLMYKPGTPNSIWVTLAATDWSWAGTGTFQQATLTWTVGSTSWSIGPSFGWSDLPQWRGMLQALTYIPDVPGVTSVAPATGKNNNAALQLTINGSNFCTDTGVTVTLVNGGNTITATNVAIVPNTNSAQLTCTVDLTGAAAGNWDVVVQNQGQTTVVPLSGGFAVQNP
jgi:hypothetical protein